MDIWKSRKKQLKKHGWQFNYRDWIWNSPTGDVADTDNMKSMNDQEFLKLLNVSI